MEIAFNLLPLSAATVILVTLVQGQRHICEMNGTLNVQSDWYDFDQRFHYTESGHVDFNYNITYSKQDSEDNQVVLLIYRLNNTVVSRVVSVNKPAYSGGVNEGDGSRRAHNKFCVMMPFLQTIIECNDKNDDNNPLMLSRKQMYLSIML